MKVTTLNRSKSKRIFFRRIVLFADLIGSTKLGEQLGDQKFHAFLNQVFWDMTEPVLEAGGEIDRYIGDEIIVSWLLPEGTSAAKDPRTAAIACIFAIEDALNARAERYRTRFGTVPDANHFAAIAPLADPNSPMVLRLKELARG